MESIGGTTIPISKVMEDLTFTIKISGLKVFKIRLWIASQIIKFASLVTRLNFDVDVVNGGK